MKKIITLALAAGLFAAAAAPASAVDITVDGSYYFQFIQRSDKSMLKDSGKQDLATQQVNLGITATVSENLSAYFAVQSYWDWGTNDYYDGNTSNGGTAFDGAKVSVLAKYAYLDWTIPETVVKVRMGRQDLRLPPLANGKNVAIWWKDPVDGISINAPVTDWLDLTAFWGRYNRNGWGRDSDGKLVNSYTNDTALSSEVDAFGLTADLKFDGFKFTPFVAYATVGDGLKPLANNKENAIGVPSGSSDIIWAGFAAQMTMFDPLTAKLGFVYGDRNFHKDSIAAEYDGYGLANGNDYASQHGWFVDASLAYKTDYGTPELLAFYGSGDKSDVDYAGQGNMPSLGGRFKGSYGYFNGSNLNENELMNNHTGMGVWGVRLGMKNISFLEGLNHELAFVFAQGTNNTGAVAKALSGSASPARYLTTSDRLYEIDFGTTYQIYKNLTAALECAYVIEDFDGGIAGRRHADGSKQEYDNAWKVALQLEYTF